MEWRDKLFIVTTLLMNPLSLAVSSWPPVVPLEIPVNQRLPSVDGVNWHSLVRRPSTRVSLLQMNVPLDRVELELQPMKRRQVIYSRYGYCFVYGEVGKGESFRDVLFVLERTVKHEHCRLKIGRMGVPLKLTLNGGGMRYAKHLY